MKWPCFKIARLLIVANYEASVYLVSYKDFYGVELKSFTIPSSVTLVEYCAFKYDAELINYSNARFCGSKGMKIINKKPESENEEIQDSQKWS